MNKNFTKALHFVFIALTLILTSSCQKNIKDDNASARPGGDTETTPKDFKNFVQLNLVANNQSYRPLYVDPNLVNAWGIEFPSAGKASVASEGKGTGVTYNLDGLKIATDVSIPKGGTSSAAHPTAQVFNPTSDFKLPNGNPAELIFVTSDGAISGWNNGNSAVMKIDRSPASAYLGVTISNDGSDFFLYAANFSQNRIDVFDKNWNPVSKPFLDPDLPAGYSPYNIKTVSDGKIYVMYAKKNAEGQAEAGPGNGYVNVFSPSGVLMKRFASKGKLDAPWGITKAPAGFWGEWSQIPNLILVANSGDGHINIFDENGNFLAPLSTKGKAVEIDGLWGITFPPITGLNRYYMYFAAGPDNGTNGLVGYIKNAFIN